jgi:hypothetical protein
MQVLDVSQTSVLTTEGRAVSQYQHCVTLVRHEKAKLSGRQLTGIHSNVRSVPPLE